MGYLLRIVASLNVYSNPASVLHDKKMCGSDQYVRHENPRSTTGTGVWPPVGIGTLSTTSERSRISVEKKSSPPPGRSVIAFSRQSFISSVREALNILIARSIFFHIDVQ